MEDLERELNDIPGSVAGRSRRSRSSLERPSILMDTLRPVSLLGGRSSGLAGSWVAGPANALTAAWDRLARVDEDFDDWRGRHRGDFGGRVRAESAAGEQRTPRHGGPVERRGDARVRGERLTVQAQGARLQTDSTYMMVGDEVATRHDGGLAATKPGGPGKEVAEGNAAPSVSQPLPARAKVLPLDLPPPTRRRCWPRVISSCGLNVLPRPGMSSRSRHEVARHA